MKNYLFLGVFALLAACGQSSAPKERPLPYYVTPDFTPRWIQNKDTLLHAIPAFSFTNQNGETVSEKTVAGKIYVANFFFTSCGTVCPQMTNHLQKVQAVFSKQDHVLLISHSVTPWIDSLPRLKSYAEHYGIDADRWHLVTGSKKEIYELARRFYFAEDEPGFNRDSTEFLHTEHLLLIDEQRHIRGIYNGTLELEVDKLIKDIHTLKATKN